MAIDFFGPVNKVINQTTTQMINDEVPKKLSNVATSFVSAIFDVVDSGLKKVQDLTKEETPPPGP